MFCGNLPETIHECDFLMNQASSNRSLTVWNKAIIKSLATKLCFKVHCFEKKKNCLEVSVLWQFAFRHVVRCCSFLRAGK